MGALTDHVKEALEKKFAASHQEVMAKVKEILAQSEGKTLQEIVGIAVTEAYWRGALDVVALGASDETENPESKH